MTPIRACLAIFAALGLLLPGSGHADEVDMKIVRALAKKPVTEIFEGSPVKPVTDATYPAIMRNRGRPVVVMFYAETGPSSRNLATMVRFIAVKYAKAIDFYAYRASAGKSVPKPELKRLGKAYSVDQVPGTLYYDNDDDRSRLELEAEDYVVPSVKQYRTPGMFTWRTYYRALQEQIEKTILD